MAKIISDTLLACEDCVQAIANDDYTGLDYHYSPKEADERLAQIKAGIASLEGYAYVGEERGFCWQGCDICKSPLGGGKHQVIVLSA